MPKHIPTSGYSSVSFYNLISVTLKYLVFPWQMYRSASQHIKIYDFISTLFNTALLHSWHLRLSHELTNQRASINLPDVECKTFWSNTFHEPFKGKFRGTVETVKRDTKHSCLIAYNDESTISLLFHHRKNGLYNADHKKRIHIKYCLGLVSSMCLYLTA